MQQGIKLKEASLFFLFWSQDAYTTTAAGPQISLDVLRRSTGEAKSTTIRGEHHRPSER